MIKQITDVKWGFIGCGEVTEKKSGPAFNMVDGSRVVAVMSRTKEKACSYAVRHHISRWYTDAQELIDDPEVNAVYIATPPSTHATYAIMAMKSGKPVYVEKPLTSNYEDCGRINRISEKTGVPCFVAYYRRYLPYFNKVHELIEQGAVGTVINVQIRFSVPPRDLDYNRTNLPWRVQPDIAGGGYFYDLAPHQNSSDKSSKPRAIVPIVAAYTKLKIRLARASVSPTASQGQGRGALSGMSRPKKTVSKSLGTRDSFASLSLPMSPSRFIMAKANKKLSWKTLRTSNCP